MFAGEEIEDTEDAEDEDVKDDTEMFGVCVLDGILGTGGAMLMDFWKSAGRFTLNLLTGLGREPFGQLGGKVE